MKKKSDVKKEEGRNEAEIGLATTQLGHDTMNCIVT